MAGSRSRITWSSSLIYFIIPMLLPFNKIKTDPSIPCEETKESAVPLFLKGTRPFPFSRVTCGLPYPAAGFSFLLAACSPDQLPDALRPFLPRKLLAADDSFSLTLWKRITFPFFAFDHIFSITRNCSVPSQLRCKIHLKSASPMGFCTPESLSYAFSSKCFRLYYILTNASCYRICKNIAFVKSLRLISGNIPVFILRQF